MHSTAIKWTEKSGLSIVAAYLKDLTEDRLEEATVDEILEGAW